MFARLVLVASVALLVARAAAAAEEQAAPAQGAPAATSPAVPPAVPPAAAAAVPAAPAPATPPAGVATVPAPATTATTATEAVPVPEGRMLNGHVFMPSAIVPGALTTTSFATYLVLAYGKTSATTTIGDRTYSGSFDYAGVGAVLGYEYAFLDYFSARFVLNELVYSGINGESAIVVGTTLATGFDLGLTASLPIGDSLRVGLLLDAGIAPGLALTIGSGLKTIIDSCTTGSNGRPTCTVSDAGIFNMNNATTIQPALAANWAPWRPLGLTVNFAYTHVSQDRGNSGTFTGDALSIGGAADFDFLAISKVPIGLQASFSWSAPINGTALQHITDLGGGIFYTGRKNLALGLQLVSRRFAVQPNVDVSWDTFLATIGLRYYW